MDYRIRELGLADREPRLAALTTYSHSLLASAKIGTSIKSVDSAFIP